jgi:O-antigen ligase
VKSKRKKTEIDPKLLSARLETILLYSTFGLLLFGPLAFGAVEPWSIFVLEAGSAALVLLWLAKQWVDGEIKLHWNPLYLPMLAFGALIVTQMVLRTSVYPHDTFSMALLYAAYAMLCFLSGQVLLRSSQARKLVVVFVIYGFIIAALALLQGVAPNGKLFWIRQPHLGGWIYGSYVNHNHYAGLMELLVPIPLVLALTRLADDKERIACGIAAAIMTATVFLSGSRGGMLAIFVELVVLSVVLFREKKVTRIAIAAAAFAVVLVSLLVWLGGKDLKGRVASISTEAHTEISGGMRLSIDRDALRMFRNKPVLGFGLGTFPVAYPQFRTFYTNFFVNEAHDDYVQLLAEMGVLGFGTMIWFVVVFYRGALHKIKNWMFDVPGAVSLACMVSVTGLLVHSLFDFNLQIPANAALFYVLCTIGAGPRLLQKSRNRRKPTPAPADEMIPTSEVV